MNRLGIIAGNGRLPFLFVEAAQKQGFEIFSACLTNECDEKLVSLVAGSCWSSVGQLAKMARFFKKNQVTKAVMAGGVSKMTSLSQAKVDWGMLKALTSIRRMGDDEILRAIARYFESQGISIVAATDYVKSVLAPVGHLAGPPLTPAQMRDVELGKEVALALGRADVGQTVIVKNGTVLAVEAVEGTDEAIRRGGKLGGTGCVVIKRMKPNQDTRFDLPAAGAVTLEVMRASGANVLAIEAGTTVLLDAEFLFVTANKIGISVIGY
jgi:UDP-2,3-diacylglucosamine hydrolase